MAEALVFENNNYLMAKFEHWSNQLPSSPYLTECGEHLYKAFHHDAPEELKEIIREGNYPEGYSLTRFTSKTFEAALEASGCKEDYMFRAWLSFIKTVDERDDGRSAVLYLLITAWT